MKQIKDILHDTDLIIINGDFVVDYSTNQHIEHLLIAEKGQYKEHPVTGVGITSELSSEQSDNAIKKEIQKQLELDNASVLEIQKSDSNKITVKAYYG